MVYFQTQKECSIGPICKLDSSFFSLDLKGFYGSDGIEFQHDLQNEYKHCGIHAILLNLTSSIYLLQ